MNVRDAMVTDVRACRPDTTLESAAMMMWEGDCGSVPVVDQFGKPVGIITDRDIAMSSALSHKPLWEIVTTEVTNGRALYTCDLDDNIKSALKTMELQKVRRLPVINGTGQLEGILTVDDVVACAERGTRGKRTPDLSYDDAINTFKGVCKHH